jgi:hypothetical protein
MDSVKIPLPAPRRLAKTQPASEVQPREATSFAISCFKRANDTKPRREILTLPELERLLEHSAVRKLKDGPLFSGATFKGTRNNANVESVSLLILDYDHGDGVTDEAGCILDVWRSLRVRAFAYTTHSHLRKVVAVHGRTKGNPNAEPRWRVVVPLSEPIPADSYPQLWAWAEQVTHGAIDSAASDASRMFYLPAKASKDAPFEFRLLPGALLDWRALKLPPAPLLRAVKNGAVEAGALGVEAGALVLNLWQADVSMEKFEMLCEVEPKFKLSWERKRKDFEDQSASSYDLSLANFAAAAGWTDQEIANLMIASRRKHGDELKLRQDYYVGTIAKARQESAREQSSPPPHDKASALQFIRDKLELKELQELPKRGETYEMLVGSKLIIVGDVNALMSWSRLRNAIYEALGVVIPKLGKTEYEGSLMRAWAIAKTDVATITDDEVMLGWLSRFRERWYAGIVDLYSNEPEARESAVIALRRLRGQSERAAYYEDNSTIAGFVDTDGRWCLSLTELKRFAQQHCDEFVSEKELGKRLSRLGFFRRQIERTDGEGARIRAACWISPPKFEAD